MPSNLTISIEHAGVLVLLAERLRTSPSTPTPPLPQRSLPRPRRFAAQSISVRGRPEHRLDRLRPELEPADPERTTLHQEIDLHVPATEVVRHIHADLNAGDLRVRLRLQCRPEDGPVHYVHRRQDRQRQAVEVSSCVGHLSFQLPAPSFPASGYEPVASRFGRPSLPEPAPWIIRKAASFQHQPWNFPRLEAGSGKLPASEHEPAPEPQGALAAGGAADLAERVAGGALKPVFGLPQRTEFVTLYTSTRNSA